MNRSIRCFAARLGLASMFLLLSGGSWAANSEWQASSGLLPHQITCPWNLFNSASPEVPTLSGGVMNMWTSVYAENMYYFQSGCELAMPDTLEIEAKVQLASGSFTSPLTGPISITFTVAYQRQNGLTIRANEIFLHDTPSTIGPIASVSTSDAVHTYRIVVAVASGAIEVFYDVNPIPVLTGTTYSSSSLPIVPTLRWGDQSSQAFGRANWLSFRHNAAPTPNCCTVDVQETDWGALKQIYR